MKNDDYRDVPLTLAVSLALWAGVVAAGTSAGVFARLPQEAYLALAAFATAFACGVVLVDARVRGWLAARGAAVAWTAAPRAGRCCWSRAAWRWREAREDRARGGAVGAHPALRRSGHRGLGDRRDARGVLDGRGATGLARRAGGRRLTGSAPARSPASRAPASPPGAP